MIFISVFISEHITNTQYSCVKIKQQDKNYQDADFWFLADLAKH